MKIITRYKNRKLYVDKKYISLRDITSMARSGEDFEVVEHGTGKNVTQRTLYEAVGQVYRHNRYPSKDLLLDLIRYQM